MYKKFAFTLSEILITLAIIGVVAAITVPSVLTTTQKYQYRSALKKTYSSLSNALNLSYGYYLYDDYRDWEYSHQNEFTEEVFNRLSRHLGIIKVCGRKFTENECFAPVKAKNGKPALFFKQNGFADNFAHLYTFVLNDGTSVAIDIWYDTSISKYAGVQNKLIVNDDNLIILVDINGKKQPNMLGRDVHMFVLTEYGLVPAGIDDKSIYCNNKKVNYNYDCTAEEIKHH